VNVRAWAELLRVSNVLTVVTNGLAATALGASVSPDPINWLAMALAVFGIVLLYLGGMTLNDVMDVAIDTRERPGRPIPSGRISRRSAFIATVVLFCVGSAGVLAGGIAGVLWLVAVLAAITGYNLITIRGRRNAGLMALCRGLIYPTIVSVQGAVGVETLVVGGIVALHTLALTFAARREADPRSAGSPVAWVMPFGPVLLLLAPLSAERHLLDWILVANATLWLIVAARWCASTERSPVRGVLAAIAGFCLLDAVVLARMQWIEASIAAVICFVITIIAHRKILGT